MTNDPFSDPDKRAELLAHAQANGISPEFFDVIVEAVHAKAGIPRGERALSLVDEAYLQKMRSSSPDRLVDSFAMWTKHSARTQKAYSAHMRQFATWLDGMGLYDVTRRQVRLYARYLQHTRTPTLASSSVKAHLAAITSFYEWLAYHDESAPPNPARDVIRPKVVHERQNILTNDELYDLLHTITNPRDHIQTWLLAYTGCRAGELQALKWRDVDFQHRLIHVLGKGDKHRTIPMHDALAPELERWRSTQLRMAEANTKLAAALSRQTTAHVLLTRNGTPLPDHELWRSLKRRAAKAEVMLKPPRRYPSGQLAPNRSEITPHTLRRTMATTLLQIGIELDAVADLLGHASVDTTRTHYAFSSNRRSQTAINAFRVQ